MLGALSSTTYNQVLDPNWIYFGIPGIKLKKNKYAQIRRDIIVKRSADDETKIDVTTEVFTDKAKKKLIKTEESEGKNVSS
jgi:hypothetical protein